uniref:Uncharacterized protein n=1 Tax=Amphimedon queenslandica TaxID=400682 RepID=A0A1X7VRD0_AMPQE
MGYCDNVEDHNFGLFKRNVYIPHSNVMFKFEAEVISLEHPQSSGFVVAVTEEGKDNAR